jgi:hypothetical protein
MKVKLIFDDWRKDGLYNSIYDTEEGIELCMGDCHHGTIFQAELNIDSDLEQEIRNAAKQGANPVFSVFIDE